MRCRCCNKILTPPFVYRTIKYPDPLDPTKNIIKHIEEDFCNDCVSYSDTRISINYTERNDVDYDTSYCYDLRDY